MDSPLKWVNVSEAGYWQFQFSDFTIDGKLMGLCSKYGARQCQGVLDTGSSLMMGPKDVVDSLTTLLTFGDDTRTNCTDDRVFPKLGFVIGGEVLEMEPDDYMDRSRGPTQPTGTGTCWAHLMPIVRAFYTVYDVKESRIGIARAKHGGDSPAEAPQGRVGEVPLMSLRPSGDDLGGDGRRLSNRPSKATPSASVQASAALRHA